ncbi:hypothetical protein [Yersinia pseudotuberculosis]|uniref:hypothetical protein n=1 Tax=Yersinia pseudotuberculosis TaxID=633 RepID=UPI00061CBD51|nr:hypothetical protein [Yersinia pseudotuberculosis]BET61389.1 hypothetical protein YPSE1_08480 [Yersinia pseudotuberculosis]CNL25143.1 Uncharacterised protein [Yersinia pseudotuberculosis]
MATKGKDLSNPFSTGSGGARFESNIQATFVTLMLSGGYAPCLPAWPIVEIKLQGMIAGYATDDLIVTIKNPIDGKVRRLLGQVKHSITCSSKNKIFKEIIQAAWSDFNNPKVFTKGKDVIALITGPISATDTDGVNGLLDQARNTCDAVEFLTRVSRAKFCSNNIRGKLEVFRDHLKAANNGNDVKDKDLFEFLKHFHLLGYDLARKGSVVSSLLHSHIGQFNKDIPDKIWYQIVSEVQEFNQNAGTIILETLSEDLIKHFSEPQITYIPKEFATEKVDTEKLRTETDWNQHPLASKLAIANLIGSWNESRDADKDIVTQIVGEDYSSWVNDLREVLQDHDCPLAFKNGVWNFKDRKASWQILGSRIFDDHLEKLKTVIVNVLRHNDPSFELPREARYASALHGKVLLHSDSLRKGLAETLALIGSRPALLTNCSYGVAERITCFVARELLEGSNWMLWGSLNNLLPIISEACPNEFLSAVEQTIGEQPSPFDTLFSQEDAGVFGRNYITGLLWALEGIAWEEAYLSRVAVILAELASHDPGGNWANRPINSLIDIFLPWLPHTLASAEKRQVALRTICNEQPEVGWKLLGNLLPNQHTTTSGTHKPNWRDTVPANWEKSVSNAEYWEQSDFCAQLMVQKAGFDVEKLAFLVSKYDVLPSTASSMLRNKLAAEQCINLPEEERVIIWSELSKFIARHRRFPEAEWSLGEDLLLEIEDIASLLAPKNLVLLHKRLFSEGDAYLYEGLGDWEKEREKLVLKRQSAVSEILAIGGISAVLAFMENVNNSSLVGEALAAISNPEFDNQLLPNLLNIEKHRQWSFIAAYAWHRLFMFGWQWVDNIDMSEWEPKKIALLLCALPFERNAWDRAQSLLGDNYGEYWKYTSANTYQSDDSIEYAMNKLLEFGRPSAVIEGLCRELYRKQEINTILACDALIAFAENNNPDEKVDSYSITELIKYIQKNKKTDQEKLFKIEWIYLNILNEHNQAAPITLENKLSSDPVFFCELIQLIYRADGIEKEGELSEKKRNLATNAYRLLSKWETVPGAKIGEEFDPGFFMEWLTLMESIVRKSGHYDVAMIKFGYVLVNAPEGPDGLWIHPVIAEAMNNRERSSLRDGYRSGVFNSRGAHFIDPEAKPEKALAEKYRKRADEVENVGYHRLATTLREIATGYDNDAERILSKGVLEL